MGAGGQPRSGTSQLLRRSDLDLRGPGRAVACLSGGTQACYVRGKEMEFRLLGSLEVLDGQRVVRVGGGKRRSLLALLVLHRNEVVSADRLIDALWGESPPPTAAKGLQVHVSQLRKELQPH